MPALLGFDGGGVRGIVALILAARLQEALDMPYAFWDFFHSVVGTSVGGVIALDLVVHRSSLSESQARFHRWVTQIFPPQPYSCLPYCQKLCNLLVWLLRDSKYDSRVLDQVMQQAFGTTESLFQTSSQSGSGTRLGIMATMASTSQLCILTNYEARVPPIRDTGYHRLRPVQEADEPLVWKVARATVAAPGYFRPTQLRPFGLLQDGGLRANNPIEAGLWELGSIWPGHARPGLVLSIGTGYQRAPTHDLHGQQGFWYDRCMPRIVRAFMASPCLHGQNSWTSLLNRVDEGSREDFFRLNLEFDGGEPALDDVSTMSWMRDVAWSCHLDLAPYRDAIWASAFFFELADLPKFDRGHFVCRGEIYCRFADARPLIRAMRGKYPRLRLILDSKPLCRFSRIEDMCPVCGLFRQSIEFEVRHLDRTIHLALEFDRDRHRHLASFPNSIQWIVDRQSHRGSFWSWHQVAKCQCLQSMSNRKRGCVDDRMVKRQRRTL